MKVQKVYQTIGSQLMIARSKAGMSQRELGKAAGIAREMIPSYEKGRVNVTVETLHKMAEAMGCVFEVSFRKVSATSKEVEKV
jgi:transcriptional regulator with XRE-family HTH domain